MVTQPGTHSTPQIKESRMWYTRARAATCVVACPVCSGAVLTSLLLLVRVQDLEEGLIGLRLVAEALLDGGHVRDGVVELRRLKRQTKK